MHFERSGVEAAASLGGKKNLSLAKFTFAVFTASKRVQSFKLNVTTIVYDSLNDILSAQVSSNLKNILLLIEYHRVLP